MYTININLTWKNRENYKVNDGSKSSSFILFKGVVLTEQPHFLGQAKLPLVKT